MVQMALMLFEFPLEALILLFGTVRLFRLPRPNVV